MMKSIFIPVFLIFSACSYSYMSIHAQKVYKKHCKTELVENQVEQLKTLYFKNDTNGKMIYIEPILTKDDGNTGIYGCNYYATHFGHVTFFQYSLGDVVILNRDNLDSLQTRISAFLIENKFSEKQIEKAKEKVKII